MVIASEVAELPDEAAISAATLAELHFGVQLARTDAARSARIRRLAEVEARFEPLPIDGSVARAYGALAARLSSSGRAARTRTMDILIAATAHAHRVPLYTRDRGFLAFSTELEIRVV